MSDIKPMNPGCQSCKYFIEDEDSYSYIQKCCQSDNSHEQYNYLTGIKETYYGYCLSCNDNCKCTYYERRNFPNLTEYKNIKRNKTLK